MSADDTGRISIREEITEVPDFPRDDAGFCTSDNATLAVQGVACTSLALYSGFQTSE